MSRRILFVMLHPGFIRYYEDALRALADAGHELHLAFEISRDKLREHELARRLEASSPRITCGTTPPRVESVRAFLARGDRGATRSGDAARPLSRRERRAEAWESLATTVRLLLDYLRFFEPAFAGAVKLRDRAEKRLPRVYVGFVRAVARGGPSARRALAAALQACERLLPPQPAIEAFLRQRDPDLLLVTPLIELGSQQVDYVTCARRLGVRSALAVASWDNLTSKGLIRVIPDHVLVWNEAQKREAVELHGAPADRVVITGAQVFDRWFGARPSRTREEFCRLAGLDPERPYVLYVGSSIFIAPDEVPFAERWLHAVRRRLPGLGVLFRPHPANSRQWRAFEPPASGNAAIWPPIGSDPTDPDFARDFFDSMFHSAAVVGINTSAQIEAGILGRPVFTVQVPEFAHAQAGTLHFHHLVDPEAGLVRTAATLEEHAEQLAAVVDGGSGDAGAANARFVQSFIRPFGTEVAAVPAFRDAVAGLASLPRPVPMRESALVRVARVPVTLAAYAARALAEDRPLWVHALRPVMAAGVWLMALGYGAASAGRTVARRSKPMRRRAQRFLHDSSRTLGKRGRRANKALSRAVRTAGSAARRAVKRA